MSDFAKPSAHELHRFPSNGELQNPLKLKSKFYLPPKQLLGLGHYYASDAFLSNL